MRNLVFTFLLLAVALAAHAEDRRCLVSFDSAVLNVCNGEIAAIDRSLERLADQSRFESSSIRVVKFEAAVGQTQRQALEGMGATILGYVPHHAFLVNMPAQLDAQASAIDGVIWTGPYLPIWKLDINLAQDLAADANLGKGTDIIRQAGLDTLLVGLHAGRDRSELVSLISRQAGLELLNAYSGFDGERLLVGFDRGMLADNVRVLAEAEAVAFVSLHWPNEFMNSQGPGLHQSGDVASRPIFDQGIFGCGQIIGAADSGLHASHCSFSDTDFGQPVTSVCATGAACPGVTPDFDHRKVGAHYKWDGSTSGGPADGHGHGTHVMGSILGNNPNSAVDCENYTTPGGVTNLDGTAPGAQLISQEMGASLQYLNTLGGTIYHAATIAYDNGARIHNNSWGSSCRNQIGSCIAGCQVEYRQTTRDADAAVWDYPELALFVAAGNSGGLGGNAGCGPGADVGAAGNGKNVFSVGSNNRGTGGDNMSGFSSRGPTQDRRSKPDMTAQGASIQSASRTACGTTSMSGTSMATPTAAGLAALVREYLARGFYPMGVETPAFAMPEPSAALIKAIMINGAHEMTGSGTTGGAPSQSQGWGRVHLDNALYFDGDARRLWLADETDGLETDGTDSHFLTVEAGQPLIVTLSWHDAPALVNANPHSVNRLRLEVHTPSGDVWTQKLTPGGGLTNPNPFQADTAGDYDDANNVHQIVLDTPVSGAYEVRVRGIQVAQGPQPYALAATGLLSGLQDPIFMLQASASQIGICAGDDADLTVGVMGLLEFDDPVTLDVLDVPAPAMAGFSVNPVTPADPANSSLLQITNTGGVADGTYALVVEAASDGPAFPATSQTTAISLVVDAAAPGVGDLLSPAPGSVGESTSPNFSWDAFAGASEYRIQVATDPAFSSLVIDQVISGTSYTPATALSPDTSYFWRVTGANQCGSGQTSAVASFATENVVCSAPGVAIPDNSPGGVSDQLVVSGGGQMDSLRLELDITHTWVGDLQVILSKGSTSVTVVDRPGYTGSGFGCSGNDIRVFLDDEATLSIQNDCTSGANPTAAFIDGESYLPANDLSDFAGEDLAGEWTLQVIDNATGDTGTLDAWCLLPAMPEGPELGLFKSVTAINGDPDQLYYSATGDVISYQLLAINNGIGTLDDVEIDDPQLGALECVPAMPASLAPGESLVCTGEHVVSSGDMSAGEVINTATAQATADGEPIDTVDSVTTRSATIFHDRFEE